MIEMGSSSWFKSHNYGRRVWLLFFISFFLLVLTLLSFCFYFSLACDSSDHYQRIVFIPRRPGLQRACASWTCLWLFWHLNLRIGSFRIRDDHRWHLRNFGTVWIILWTLFIVRLISPLDRKKYVCVDLKQFFFYPSPPPCYTWLQGSWAFCFFVYPSSCFWPHILGSCISAAVHPNASVFVTETRILGFYGQTMMRKRHRQIHGSAKSTKDCDGMFTWLLESTHMFI